jgi:acetyltransferase-like isoleucine patch superfamily enzyme
VSEHVVSDLPVDASPDSSSVSRRKPLENPPKQSRMQYHLQQLLHKIAFVSPGGWGLRPKLHRWRGVTIGERVWIGLYVYMEGMYPQAISIGDNSIIGVRTSIFCHILSGYGGPVIIEENVFVGPHCVILPNVRIGRGSVIRAGTVVARNVPPGTFWGAPDAGPLARVSVPLMPQYSYEEFVEGLRPIRKRRDQEGQET